MNELEKEIVCKALMDYKKELWTSFRKSKSSDNDYSYKIEAIEKGISLIIGSEIKSKSIKKIKTTEGFTPNEIDIINKSVAYCNANPRKEYKPPGSWYNQ